jgi:hypothetical protein
MPIIPGTGRLKEKNHEFKGSLGYIESSRQAWTTIMRPCHMHTYIHMYIHKIYIEIEDTAQWKGT